MGGIMRIFEFSKNITGKVISELQEAGRFIKIAVFQLHNPDIFKVLDDKLREGIKVEIFTLPYDSIHGEIRDEVSRLFQDIERKGATLYFCKWNVGDPRRTTTVVGRWYSFHGKFIVTDKSAIVLSANFIKSQELDVIVIFKNEQEKIDEYNLKFEELIELFITERSGYNGAIREKIINTNLPGILSVFELPPVIETDIHKDHWIKDYPSILCPKDVSIEEKLYLVPFDCKGRDFLMLLLSEASEFAYVSTESFTDPDFAKYLIKRKLKGLDIRILGGATSMDFSDRIQNMIRELLAYGIKMRTTEEDIHAKLIITNKHLVVSSINLNKMNLGFKTGSEYWRGNTETIAVCSDEEIIAIAKTEFMDIYNKSMDIKIKLAQKIENTIGSMFNTTFGLRSRQEVKTLFAHLIIRKEIQVKKIVIDVGKIVVKLMKFFNKRIVEKNDFLFALILYYLAERKHDFDQLEEKLKILNTQINLRELLDLLIANNFIEKVEDFYRIKVENLF